MSSCFGIYGAAVADKFDKLKLEETKLNPSATGDCIDRYILYASSKILGFSHSHEHIWWILSIPRNGVRNVNAASFIFRDALFEWIKSLFDRMDEQSKRKISLLVFKDTLFDGEE